MLSNKYKLSTRGLQTSISRFSLSAGSGSVSRLFLAIMSLAFAAQRLFYRPLWLFFSPFSPPSSVWEGAWMQPLPFLCSISPPTFPSLLSWRDWHPACVYRWPALSSAPQQMNLLIPSRPGWPPTPCLYSATWLSKFLSLAVTHATGADDKWRDMTDHMSGRRLWHSARIREVITASKAIRGNYCMCCR